MAYHSDSQFDLLGQSLPEDRIVSRYCLEERLRLPFRFEVEFSTTEQNFDVEELLNSSLALSIKDSHGGSRFAHGIVTEAFFQRAVGERLHFVLILRPALWLLSQRSDCRIFQEKTSQEVISEILEDAGLAKTFTWKTSAVYPPREFLVQYRETTLNFIQRLLEDEGIYYHFDHSTDGHQLVFTDQLKDLAEGEPEPLSLTPGGMTQQVPLLRVRRRRSLRLSQVDLSGFDPNNPEVKPSASSATDEPNGLRAYGYRKFPGGPKSATHYAEAELKAARADADTLYGQAQLCSLMPGRQIEVEGTHQTQLHGNYVLVNTWTNGLAHQDSGSENSPAGAPAPEKSVDIRFEALSPEAVYAPKWLARRPKINGIQTALVVGEAEGAQSIDVDELGRIKVHFFWDRLQAADKNASCRIRVNQVPLGGSMILPRVGWEVLVAFEDGNPDQPVILGRTYNSENMPPVSLPDNKAATSLSSSSSPGGAGTNEISFGDSGGRQGFAISAQKDLNTNTGYDQSEEITLNDDHLINANYRHEVGVDQAVSIGATQTENFGANLALTVQGNQSKEVGGNEFANAKGNILENIKSDRTLKIGGNLMMLHNGERTQISGNMKRKIDIADLEVSASSLSENIKGDLTTTANALRAHLVQGTHSEVVSGSKTETTQGGEIHMNGGSHSATAEGATAQVVGGLVQRKAKGDLSIKAPMISIIGASGQLKGGSSLIKISGGTMKLKGSSVVVKAAMTKITAGSLKLG